MGSGWEMSERRESVERGVTGRVWKRVRKDVVGSEIREWGKRGVTLSIH